ncbi:MAG: prolyl oligopeptidase family serine peptidase [Burkholderiaceae bacterium]|nr:prolyl oligopeptidase family serine peptidase [Burkholderiaceae bacterium]
MTGSQSVKRAAIALVCALLCGLAGLPAALAGDEPAKPRAAPPAPVADIRDEPQTLFGTVVPDPYRYFENVKAPEVAAWMKAHASRTRALLDSIGARSRLIDTLRRIDDATPARVTAALRTPSGLWFYEKRVAGANQYSLHMRQGLAGPERLLVDPEALSRGTRQSLAINWFSPSPDGRYLAYGLSAGGSEDAVMHVLDVRSGRPVGRPVDRMQFAGVSWDGENTLYFNRLAPQKPDSSALDKFQRSAVYRMTVGAPAPQPVPVLGYGVAGVTIDPAEIPYVSITHDGRWALGWIINGVQREIRMYVAPAASLRASRPAWRALVERADEVSRADYFDDTLYLISHRTAPRSKVMALDIRAGTMGQARELLAHSERVITGLGTASDALYVEARAGNIKELLRLPYRDGAAQTIKLPIAGAFTLSPEEGGGATDPRLPGAVIELQGWTQARQIYEVRGDGTVTNTGLQPQGPYDTLPDVVTTEVQVPGHDGQLVPMSIIHRRDTPLDGNRPTLLYGYAAYGNTEEPYYSVFRMAWLQAGGVHAIANPRGSGVYGEQWYKDGYQATKPNSWKDFIACAEYLVAGGYTRPQRLGILGGSAGGILVGRAMTERPDLFAAVISSVGALDMVRAEDSPNGVPNIPEFGSKRTEPGFRALLAMSTYHQIRDGTPYPAVMLTHGVNDPRVEVWHSTKTAARLMAASASARPVLLRLDFDAGHGIGSTKQQDEQERADMIVFLLWQMGEPGYAPAP